MKLSILGLGYLGSVSAPFLIGAVAITGARRGR